MAVITDMNTLEISTITILHTLSTLDIKKLSLLSVIARNDMSSLVQLTEAETILIDNQIKLLLEKFKMTSLEDLSLMLQEINFLSLIKGKHII